MTNINKIKVFMRNFMHKVILVDYEKENLLKFFKQLNLPKEHKILEIGCGYGRNLKILTEQGFNIEGVDINENIVRKNCQDGMNCSTVEKFSHYQNATIKKYGVAPKHDVLLLSHIIEHFSPEKLKEFLEHNLQYLKNNGYLIISCPLYTPFFYDDFDHVKPYHPVGINQVFDGKNAQIQYHSYYTLNLQDIWFRRSYYRIIFKKGIYINTWSSYIYKLINLAFAILFRVTGGLIGVTSGWMGIYKKTDSIPETSLDKF